MTQFQGAGFSIELPEGYVDVTNYVFAFPCGEPFSPNLTISAQSVDGDIDLIQCANSELAAIADKVEAYALIQQVSGRRAGMDGVMSLFEWGSGLARIRQKQVLLLSSGTPKTKFSLMASCLVSQCAKAEPVFDQVLASFLPTISSASN